MIGSRFGEGGPATGQFAVDLEVDLQSCAERQQDEPPLGPPGILGLKVPYSAPFSATKVTGLGQF